jgi:uncharacterized alkaline shock family protein YloU
LNVRERVYLALTGLLLAVAGAVIAAVTLPLFPLERLQTSLAAVHGDIRFALVSVVLLLLAAVVLIFSMRRGAGEETLLQSGPLGEVRICFTTIENLVLKAAREIKGVRDIKTRVVVKPAGLVIFLRAVAFAGQNIPQLAAQLQTAVKEYVENIAGSQVAEVKVMIENVTAETVKGAH